MSRLVYGVHAVRALAEGGRRIEVLHVLQSLKLRAEMEALAASSGARLVLAPRDVLDTLAGSRHHQGVIAEVAERRELNEDWIVSRFETPSEDSLLLALDGVEDPRNLGACVRTAAAAGVDALLYPKNRGASMTPVAEKTASGGAERVPIVALSNLVRRLNWLKSRGFQIIGADGAATTAWHEADFNAPTVLVVGSEGKGLRKLSKETCDLLVSLPVQGGIRSLNVSVAAGVLLYEALRQRQCAR